MPKSSKDFAKIIKSLGPDDSKSKTVINASVREMEQRWPLLKTTPPQKLEQTPELTEEERHHWLSSPQTRAGNRKQVLSVSSVTSKEKLAESLRKMAGTKAKPQAIASINASVARPKPVERVAIAVPRVAAPVKSNVETKLNVDAKTITQLKKVVEIERDSSVKQHTESSKFLDVKKPLMAKKAVPETAVSQPVTVAENKSLRGIFGRLSGKKIEAPTPPPQQPLAKLSILKKLSKR
jgi:hypothetical protein